MARLSSHALSVVGEKTPVAQVRLERGLVCCRPRRERYRHAHLGKPSTATPTPAALSESRTVPVPMPVPVPAPVLPRCVPLLLAGRERTAHAPPQPSGERRVANPNPSSAAQCIAVRKQTERKGLTRKEEEKAPAPRLPQRECGCLRAVECGVLLACRLGSAGLGSAREEQAKQGRRDTLSNLSASLNVLPLSPSQPHSISLPALSFFQAVTLFPSATQRNAYEHAILAQEGAIRAQRQEQAD